MPTNLQGTNISDTYQKVVQVEGGQLSDGTGSALPLSFDGNDAVFTGAVYATSITSSRVTSSVIYTGGSSTFGDEASDTHTFSGAITASAISLSDGMKIGKVGSFPAIGHTLQAGHYALGANASYTALNAGTGDYITFNIGNTEKMRMNSSGQLGIGVSPSHKLDVAGTIRGTGGTILGDAVSDTHTFTGNITASNGSNISASATSYIQTPELRGAGSATQLHVQGQITASGNISSSGNIYANEYYSNNQFTHKWDGSSVKIGDNTPVLIQGNITASNNISASGDIIATGTGSFGDIQSVGGISLTTQTVGYQFDNISVFYHDGNDIQVGDPTNHVNFPGQGIIASQITASGNISSSGDISANEITASNIMLRDGGSLTSDHNQTLIKMNNDDSWSIHANSSDTALLISNAGVRVNYENASALNFQADGTYGGLFLVDAGDDFVEVSGSLRVTGHGHITASGNISSSGTLYANNIEGITSIESTLYKIDDQNVIDYVSDTHLFGSTSKFSKLRTQQGLEITAPVTASGNISSSGDLIADTYDAKTSGAGYKLDSVKVVYVENAKYHFGRQGAGTAISGSTIELGKESTTHVTASGNISASAFIGQRVYIGGASSNISTPSQNLYFYGGSNGLVSNTWNVDLADQGGSFDATTGRATIPPQYINNMHILPCSVEKVTLKSYSRMAGKDVSGGTNNFIPSIWMFTGSMQNDSNNNLVFGFAASQSLHSPADGETNGSGTHHYHINITGSKSFTPNSGDELICVALLNEGNGTQAWRFNYRVDAITTE